ncbi:hypothetical protein RBWH47_05221 [Rhodopirellula baltica WH47]|uniref:Uncharacterized protein n=1 Tax=Rhodopirellula baltica WH47 TaxID=991778 RepID=F2ANH3_RHOBT|nr:hypothetical protein RBWH47_05221 [Rhodopirellula baltica WH47]
MDNPSSSKGKSTCLTISGHPWGGFVRGFFAGFTPSEFRTREKNRPSILLERLLSIRSLRDDFHQSFG